MVKILLRIQQALPSILSTYADALTDCHASLPFLSFKYWDIILTQATAASASHLVMHNHTLSLCNRTCAVDKMSLNELEEYSDTQNNIKVCRVKTEEKSVCKRMAPASFL